MNKKVKKLQQPAILNHLDTQAVKQKSKKFFWYDFKKFWVNPQIINLAIGVIVGQALANFIRAIITDWFTPIITFLMGNNSMPKGIAIGPIVFQYSDILTELVNLTINGFAVYIFLSIWRSAFMTKEELDAPSENELLTKLVKETKQNNKLQKQEQILIQKQYEQNQALLKELQKQVSQSNIATSANKIAETKKKAD